MLCAYYGRSSNSRVLFEGTRLATLAKRILDELNETYPQAKL